LNWQKKRPTVGSPIIEEVDQGDFVDGQGMLPK
jgi:hypothetical protein